MGDFLSTNYTDCHEFGFFRVHSSNSWKKRIVLKGKPENHFTMKDVKKLKFKNTFMVKCIPALRG